MTVIRVDPASVQQYGSAAQEHFDAVRHQLQGLVDDAVGVRYFGPNAVDFKTQCGQLAADFASKLGQDLGRIAEAVRASTTAIATSLGGAPLTLSVNATAIAPPPVPAGDGSVELDTDALTDLKPAVTRRIGEIDSRLDAHLTSLQNTNWEGQAKENAVNAVRSFTSTAKTRSSEASTSITNYIDSQIQAVLEGDR